MKPPAMYNELPREPGGDGVAKSAALELLGSLATRLVRTESVAAPPSLPAVDAAPRKPLVRCTSSECVGPAYCVHVTLDAGVEPSDDAVEAFKLYAQAATPLIAPQRTLERVHALLAAGVSPATLVRAGASWNVLVALGITLDDLITLHGFPLEDVMSAFELTWRRLLAGTFHWRLLERSDSYPLCVLAPEVSGSRLSAAFAVGYRALTRHLSPTDVLALDIDAPLARLMGAQRVDMARLCDDEEMRNHGGVPYVVRAFRLSHELFIRMPEGDIEPSMRSAYAMLTMVIGWR